MRPSDLPALPLPENGKHYELSRGELLVVGNAGSRQGRAKRRIMKSLVLYTERHPIGEVFLESQFTLSPENARIPDVAFVTNRKLASDPQDDSSIPFAPDLAVEIVSVSEKAADTEGKVQQYLAAATAEVWQVYLNQRLVRVSSLSGSRDVLPGQTLTGAALPGFSVPIESFFTSADKR